MISQVRRFHRPLQRFWLLVVLVGCVGFGTGCAITEDVGQNSYEVAPGLRITRQSGKFSSRHGQEGTVNFPAAYQRPPNLEIDSEEGETQITECTATGFKWKNTSVFRFDTDDVTWVARGVLAGDGGFPILPRIVPHEALGPTSKGGVCVESSGN
jgi:hypothetical protein